jgi:hypothetical protein
MILRCDTCTRDVDAEVCSRRAPEYDEEFFHEKKQRWAVAEAVAVWGECPGCGTHLSILEAFIDALVENGKDVQHYEDDDDYADQVWSNPRLMPWEDRAGTGPSLDPRDDEVAA